MHADDDRTIDPRASLTLRQQFVVHPPERLEVDVRKARRGPENPRGRPKKGAAPTRGRLRIGSSA